MLFITVGTRTETTAREDEHELMQMLEVELTYYCSGQFTASKLLSQTDTFAPLIIVVFDKAHELTQLEVLREMYFGGEQAEHRYAGGDPSEDY